MNMTLFEVCQRARPELACLGELGRPLLEIVVVVERLAAGRDVDALADPGFALDVLTAATVTPPSSGGCSTFCEPASPPDLPGRSSRRLPSP